MIPIPTLATLEQTKERIQELTQLLREQNEAFVDREAVEIELADIVAGLPTSYLGPTWQKNDAGGWLLPEHTLGLEIAAWCMLYLRHPDSTDDDPTPWRFTKEQLRFLLWWYAIDEDGRFLFRKGVLQRLKGWG